MKFFEDYFPDWLSGVNFKKSVTLNDGFTVPSGQTVTIASAINVTSPNSKVNTPLNTATPVAVNATATLTAAQVASGYITSTSAAAVTMTLPTGTLLGGVLGATQGMMMELYIDNTAGANTVTVAVAVNGILSAAAAAGSSAGAGLLTVPSGVTGLAQFTIMFSSATAYVFSRSA